MLCIFVTDDVSKLLKSSDVRLEELLNMYDVFVTDDVSKPLTSSDVRLEQL